MVERIFIALLFSTLATTAAWSQSPAPAISYGSDFLWGAAYSAHQTEGKTGGGENGDWFEFEHPVLGKSPIQSGHTADLAVDHWNRYEEDLQAAKKLGLNTLRTSIAWEKIEPQKGVFKKDIIAHYRAEFRRMRELGLRPMVCLHHFTHPLWFQKEGGWTNPNSAAYFLQYAKFVVENLSDVVDLWITFNEPMILVQMGYMKAEVPPEKAGLKPAFEAAFNTARAHRMVVQYIHGAQGVPRNQGKKSIMGVGVAYAFGVFDPGDGRNAADVKAAQVLTELTDWAWLRAAETGHLEFKLQVPGKADKIMARDMPASDLPKNSKLTPFYDWIGVNYYQRYLIKYNLLSPIPFTWITPQGPKGDNGWSIYPEGLERLLREVTARFKYPMVVTENGLADGDDHLRPQFIREHLKFLDRAIHGSDKGAALDIRGYYHWSLMDNFEWLSGYNYKFGLYEVQRSRNLQRVARASAQVYATEIAARK